MGSAIMSWLAMPGVVDMALGILVPLVTFAIGHKHWLLSPPKKSAGEQLLDMFVAKSDGHIKDLIQAGVAKIFHRVTVPEGVPMPSAPGAQLNVNDVISGLGKLWAVVQPAIVSALKEQPAPAKA